MSSLNPKVFDDDVEQVAIRQGFGEGFLIAGRENPNLVGLCADLTESTRMDLFKEAFPERFIEVGVAEQNLASVASGMAAMGKVPFISSYAMFSPGRNWEQIRTTICYNNANVKIAGSHAGVSVGPDGGSHQALEDLAITRVLPRMIVISPCDAIEAKKATIAAARVIGPTYIRLAREKTPIITTEEAPFEIGKANILYQGVKKADVGIIATGALVHQALLAARQLEKDDVSVKVLNLSTVKPMDQDAVISLARETNAIVTVEEHQKTGGMGSAVAECLARNYPVRMVFIGVDDRFGQSGKPAELINYYGMGSESIVQAVMKLRNLQ
jgi:transketolase